MLGSSEAVRIAEELSNAFGPSGFEDDAVNVIRRHTEDLGDVEEDSLRNLYVRRRENTGGKPVLMLDAHTDEVGLIVKAVKPNGTLEFLQLGNWNKTALPSTKVRVRNTLGEYISGIIAAKPVHFMSEREKNAAVEVASLYIDIGASSREEAIDVFHIGIGEPVVPATAFEYDEKRDLMFGKGFDCRIGCAALILTLRALKGRELPVDIVGVFSSQEEVGERGVSVAVNKVKPDIALCFEGAPADDTFTEAWGAQTVVGKGPMLRYMDRSIICNPRYMRFALSEAEKAGIPVQASVREGGGNNGAIINLADNGVPVIIAGVPVRYIHTPNCITTARDLESAVKFAVRVSESLTGDIIAGF